MSQPAGPVRALPGARLALGLLFAINLFNYIDRQILPAVLDDVEKTFFPEAAAAHTGPKGETEGADGHIKEKLGYLQSAFMFSYFLIAPVFGFLADRFSRWKLIGVGVIVWSLASGGSGWATSFAFLLLMRCAVGIGEAAYGPAAPTIISDLYPVAIRGRVMAIFYMAIPVGSALGYVLGGLILTHMHDWRWAFYLVTPPGILLGLLCFLMPEPTRGQSELEEKSRRKVTRKDFVILLKTPSYVLVTLGMAAMTFAMGGIGYWVPYYLISTHGMKKGDANYKFGLIVVVAGFLATMLGGMAGDRLRKYFVGSYFLVSGIAMLVGCPLIALVLVTSGNLLWVCIFIACFALFFNTGPTNTVLANVTHPQMRASAFALNIFVIHALGDAVSPAIIGAIADRYSLAAGFLVMSAFVFLGGLLWLSGVRYLERDTELAPKRLDVAG